jgi:hypothetical protein
LPRCRDDTGEALERDEALLVNQAKRLLTRLSRLHARLEALKRLANKYAQPP